MVTRKGLTTFMLAAALAAGGVAGCTPVVQDAGSGSAAGSAAASGSAGSADSAALAGSAEAGSAPVEVPAEEPAPEPVEQHDFVCGYFYVDVPDGWVQVDPGTEIPQDGTTVWWVNQKSDAEFEFGRSTFEGVDNEGYPYYTAGSATVMIGGTGGRSTDGFTRVGTLPDGRDVWTFEVSAGFFASDGYFEGDTFVSSVMSVPTESGAGIILRDDAPAAEGSQGPADEAPFVATARAALKVPDDPSITYEVDSPSYWEGGRAFVTQITFYQDGELVATALCYDDGTPARNIMQYEAPQ